MMILFPINEFEKNNSNILQYLNELSKTFMVFKEDINSVIALSIKILIRYIDIDNSGFFLEKDLIKYFKISSITCFLISYKFIIDDDDFNFEILQNFTNYKLKLFLNKEIEILKFINYEILNISNNTIYE